MVQQLHISTKTQWKCQAVPISSKVNQVFIGPVHRGSMLNDIFPKLNNAKYLSLVDASFGYHNVKLDERSSYLTMLTCQFGGYRYKRFPFEAASTGGYVLMKNRQII